MKNWYAVEVCRNFLISVSVGFRTGFKSFVFFFTVGYPNVSPSGLFIPPLTPVRAQVEEEERTALSRRKGFAVWMRNG